MPKPRVVRHAVTQPLDKAYRLIPLTQGQNAIVDLEDFEWLNQWNWFAMYSQKTETFYAVRNKNNLMHREILKSLHGEDSDHRNHDTLDNRKENLRRCTRSQNNCNQGPNSRSTSGYKGVTKCSKSAKWQAKIKVHRRIFHLGEFADAEDAARAYDAAAKKYHGEFAHLNFHECVAGAGPRKKPLARWNVGRWPFLLSRSQTLLMASILRVNSDVLIPCLPKLTGPQ